MVNKDITMNWKVTVLGGGKKALTVVAMGKGNTNDEALKGIYDSIKKKAE